VVGEERVDAGRAGLLLALDEELEVDRQATVGGQKMADGGELEVDLPLVVGGAARVQAAVAHGRLEGRAGPQLERVDRLHVVVTVDGDRGRLRAGAQPLRVHRRLATVARQHLSVQPGGLHQPREVLGRTTHFEVIGRISRDGGDCTPLRKLGDEGLGRTFHEGVDVSHGMLPADGGQRSAADDLGRLSERGETALGALRRMHHRLPKPLPNFNVALQHRYSPFHRTSITVDARHRAGPRR
jgi:hypothetical protein